MSNDAKLLQDLLSEYAGSTGMGPITLDDAGRCCLLFDDKLSVTLETQPETGALLMSTELGPVPADGELPFCRQMLEGNHFWRYTGGVGTLALAPEENPNVPRHAVLLFQTPLQCLDCATFRNRLADFVDTAEAWMDHLGSFEPPTVPGSAPLADLWRGSPMLRA